MLTWRGVSAYIRDMTTTDTATAPTTVGTVFAHSWGYNQTNVDFYEITEISRTGKSGKARKIRSSTVAVYGTSDSVVPADGEDRFEVRQGCARCSNSHEGEPAFDGHAYTIDYTWQARTDRLTVTSNGDHAYRWNGRPMYTTGYGFGH
jgi:hypothetical protein